MKKLLAVALLLSASLLGAQKVTLDSGGSYRINVGPPQTVKPFAYVTGSGTATAYYWLSVVYPVGETRGVYVYVTGMPGTLDGTHYVTLRWNAQSGATSYKVYKTMSSAYPSGGTDLLCAGTSLTCQDSGQALTTGDPPSVPPLAYSEIGSATTGESVIKLADKGGQVFNVKAYGAIGDGATDDTLAIQAAVNASNGRVLVPAGSYKLSAPIVIDHRTDFVGVGQLSKLIPASGFAGPFLEVGKDANTPAADKNQYGQLFNITLANFEIIDSGFRSQATSGIWLFGIDQALITNLQVWNLNGYALQLDNNGANNTPVRESLFKNFIAWHSGNSTTPCVNVVSDSSTGDENNELGFIGGGVKNCYGTSVYVSTNKASSVGPGHIYFDDFQTEAREADDSVAGNPLTTAPNDPVIDIVHAQNVGISHSSISNAGQKSAALYIEGTAAEPVGTVTVTDSTVGGTTQASGTVNTSGTSVTWVSGSKFQTDGSWPTWNIVINSITYTVSSVASATSLTLGTSAGTQTGVSYSVTAGNYGIQTGYISNLITKGINWLGEITGNENYAFVNGGNYYDLLPSGDGAYSLGKFVSFGSDAAFGIQNSNGGQAWALDANSNGNFSIFPKTDTTKQMRIGGVLANGNGNVISAAKVLTLAAGTATWTFATAYTAAPVCTASDQTAANAVRVEAPSTTSVKIDGTTTDVVSVICTPAAN